MWLHNDKEVEMAFYHTCLLCGCNLDPGERCDCRREKEQKENMLTNAIRIDARGQYRFDFDGLERDYREKAVI